MKKEYGHCDARSNLAQVGLSRTPQRLAVLDILIRAERPLTAADLMQAVNDNLNINKVTVYRIISTFRERGIVREIPTNYGINHYEMACMHNPVHPHFHCRSCKTMTCLDPLTLSKTWDWLAGPHDYNIEEISITLSGLCKECQK